MAFLDNLKVIEKKGQKEAAERPSWLMA